MKTTGDPVTTAGDPVSGRRMVLVHAHPDDESITTGGTIARYVAEGVEVTIVTCTLGEEGEVIGDRWAGLVADRADQLGGYRIHELDLALDALGRPRHEFLGGAGRWRDSGMAGSAAAAHPRAFSSAPMAQVVDSLVEVLRRLRPHVLVTYDPFGGYGHPDHQRVHLACSEAAAAAGRGDHRPDLGASWTVPKVYWTVTGADQLEKGSAALADGSIPVPDGWRLPEAGELPSLPDDTVTATIDVAGCHDAKAAAMAAHATQITVAPHGRAYVLSNMIAQPIFDAELFTRVAGVTGSPNGRSSVSFDTDGRLETDLFEGIDVAAGGIE